MSWWLYAQAKSFEGNDALFLVLTKRVLAQEYESGAITDAPVTRAINHPIGKLTEGLLDWWYRSSPTDDQGLPDDIKSIFSELCDVDVEKFRHGRVLLAAHVIALFRVDPDWAKANLLPRFDWDQSSSEAQAAWEGFLWSPRLYRPLIVSLKKAFLATASRYNQLGDHAEQYATVLTFAALDRGDTFTEAELASATQSLPPAGMRRTVFALVNALESAGDQRPEYWKNRIRPYLKSVWPKNRDLDTAAISESFALLCVAADTEFPDAFDQLRHWLKPLDQAMSLYHRLKESHLCKSFPMQSLSLLDALTNEQTQWLPPDFKDCLDEIEIADANVKGDRRFIRLRELSRKYGLE